MIKTPPGVDSKFRYVLLAAKRARQLQSGSPPLQAATTKKSTRTAREELELGLLKFEILAPPSEQEEVVGKKRKK
jgi:DNA-directed RNA polymerase subunit omega